MIEDLGSAAGTFVGGRQIPPHVANLVERNQEIRFGEVSARYAAPPEVAAAQEGAAPLEPVELERRYMPLETLVRTSMPGAIIMSGRSWLATSKALTVRCSLSTKRTRSSPVFWPWAEEKPPPPLSIMMV